MGQELRCFESEAAASQKLAASMALGFAAQILREVALSYWIQVKLRDGMIVAPFAGGSGPAPRVGQLVDCPVGDRNVQATVSRVAKSSGPLCGRERADMVDATEL